MTSIRLRLAVLASLALFAVGCASSPTPSPTPSGAPSPVGDPSEGGFRGLVVDAEGNPLQGIFVTIEQPDFYGTATTTEDGRFQATGVSGTFLIRVIDADYEPAARRVEVAPGEMVEVEFVLEPRET